MKTHMTIDAYLRNAGIKPATTAARRSSIPAKTGPDPVFSENLAAAISPVPENAVGSTGKPAGLTLSDYRRQAVPPATARFFQKSTLMNGSPRPGGPKGFGDAVAASRGKHVISDSASDGGGVEADAGGPPQTDSRALIADSIKDAARKYNLPAKLIESVIQAESSFRVDAVSPAGAQGLMQLMPGTAKELGVDDPFDVRQNIDGGAGYLRRMMDRFGGDVKLALAAYNAGPGTVEKYNGNVPYRETQNYIERVLKGISA
ncbi:hypothetical protein DSCA_58930 [Desulfosarcina alkanivorans]|uniref:Transglycosylase SLT domain-containing protein n=1 Tax=Desulfosarcina alkanivorans TaxID=571177 RepID=A0A5K7YVC7_9BACT|nr:lytic transglycosylase domain-containing protein [Desulfosarcina alkanivorans]BBO71963.1 hypothetical protein DSCA_58930 [Desulfosarcina alkanivorans]